MTDMNNNTYIIGDSAYTLRRYGAENELKGSAEKKESVILFTERDPKAWLERVDLSNYGDNIFYLDFKNPLHSPNRWNPLRILGNLYEEEEACILEQLIHEMYESLFSEKDFWNGIGINLLSGITMSLLKREEKCLSFQSVREILEYLSNKTVLEHLNNEYETDMFLEVLSAKSEHGIDRRLYAPFLISPYDTKKTVLSVCLERFLNAYLCDSGIDAMTMFDDVNLYNRKYDPFLLCVRLPKRDQKYSELLELLFKELMLVNELSECPMHYILESNRYSLDHFKTLEELLACTEENAHVTYLSNRFELKRKKDFCCYAVFPLVDAKLRSDIAASLKKENQMQEEEAMGKLRKHQCRIYGNPAYSRPTDSITVTYEPLEKETHEFSYFRGNCKIYETIPEQEYLNLHDEESGPVILEENCAYSLKIQPEFNEISKVMDVLRSYAASRSITPKILDKWHDHDCFFLVPCFDEMAMYQLLSELQRKDITDIEIIRNSDQSSGDATSGSGNDSKMIC